jgi:hypothetical protein
MSDAVEWTTHELRSRVDYTWATQLGQLRAGWTTHGLRSWVNYTWATQLGELHMGYAAGWTTHGLRSWVGYAAGWATQLGGLRSWVINTAQWSTQLSDQHSWVINTDEWPNGFFDRIERERLFRLSWMRTTFQMSWMRTTFRISWMKTSSSNEKDLSSFHGIARRTRVTSLKELQKSSHFRHENQRQISLDLNHSCRTRKRLISLINQRNFFVVVL